ncbi:hypothetical protein CYMTET_53235 [Cymbomonas tetramitiformis]|uniref:Deacetylase sirtuin-type domain-containing protein n=1 Tax=Cymbomonas tetramitiformis TaxID=36881 RepID=A0AAE0EQT7_9CHLO|nr:hypothetical protein CYMTET_53235 [Cymbomonas tetramitiformis]
METLEEKVSAAAKLIVEAEGQVVAFTGAGISVESGIPDFRSAGGLWTKYDPELYCSMDVFEEQPELFWTMAADMATMVRDAKPNPAHRALHELEKQSLLGAVVTQNVDNLHQEAGSALVYELHGNASTSSCRACKERLFTDLSHRSVAVPCSLGSDVAAAGFSEAVQNAKVLIIIGTSLEVHPAAGLPMICKARGGHVIVCNLDTSGESIADIFLQGTAGTILPRLVAECAQQRAAL